jgi:hypothetical protein
MLIKHARAKKRRFFQDVVTIMSTTQDDYKRSAMMFTKSTKMFLWMSLIFTLLLTACTMPASGPDQGTSSETPLPQTQEPGLPGGGIGDFVSGIAQVDNIQILILESFPVQVNVVVRGNLPDGCTTIDQSLVEKIENQFRVTLTTSRPAEAACTEALVPYEEVISLDVVGLPAGSYTVDVNGVTGTFELAMDNILPEVEEPTPQPGNSTISGTVWHDLCAIAGGEGGTPAVPSSGCVSLEDGTYQANGNLEDDEPRLENIEVSLGQGACPTSGLTTTKTNQEGDFAFSNLSPGKYCVSVNAESLNNGPILIPGVWTSPASGEAEIDVDLESGQKINNLRFGWDFQFLPEPEPVQDETSCTNKLSFVEDVTFPDDSTVAGNQPFEKIWKLRNDGTCTWTTGYSLVFIEGEQLGVTSPMPLKQQVKPGEEAEFGITFTAPAAAGTYRSEWMIRSAFGQEFGTGRNGDTPFWVQFAVVESVTDLNLGEPTWRETFDSAANWFLVDSGNTRFTIDDGEMAMRSASPGSYDEWGLSTYGEVSDFYMEATVRTDEDCGGLDRYGFLLRSPDPNQGYVYGFSCDGRYRIYAWDGNSYRGLQEWTRSSSIKSGPDQTNKIGVLMDGDTIKLYANDSLLVELDDREFSSGSFGMFVASGETNNFTAFVEDLTLWELDD